MTAAKPVAPAIWVSLTLLVAVLTGVILLREFTEGTLAGPLPWDDCAIFAQALDRLGIITGARSLIDVVAGVRWLAPHSPVADIQTMLGIALTGGSIWGPYALNGVAVLAGAAAVVVVALPRRGALVTASLLIALLIQPVTLNSLAALKADWKSGFLMAVAIYLFFEAASAGSRRLWTTAAGFLAVAILCKLTGFYLPIFAVGIVLAFKGCEAIAPPGEAPRTIGQAIGALWSGRWEVLRLIAISIAPFALFFLWGAVSFYNIISYILSATSSRWDDGLSLGERAFFYGPLSNGAWGATGLLLLLLAPIAVAVTWRRERLTSAFLGAALIVGLVFFAPLVVANGANIQFSGTFVGVFVGMALVCLASLTGRAAWIGLLLSAASAFITPLATFDQVLAGQVDPPVTLAERHAAHRTVDAVAADLQRLAKGRDARLALLFEDTVAGFPTFGIAYWQRTGQRLGVDRIDDLPIGPAWLTGDKATFFLALAPSQAGVAAGHRPQSRMPTTADLPTTLAAVEALPGRQLVGCYPWKGGELRLYTDRATAGGAQALGCRAPPAG